MLLMMILLCLGQRNEKWGKNKKTGGEEEEEIESDPRGHTGSTQETSTSNPPCKKQKQTQKKSR